MTFIIDSLINNDVVFYSIFTGVTGAISYSLVSSIFNSVWPSKEYTDTGIQTDAWEDFSDRQSQIIQDSVTSIETISPMISPTEQTSSNAGIITEGASTATTVLPVPIEEVLPIPHVQVLPIPHVQVYNWDLVNQLIANRPLRADELFQMETVEKISAWVEVANNLFN